MKLLIVLAVVAAAYAEVAPATDDVPSIIRDHLIPLGEKIRQAEESRERIVGGLPSLPGVFKYQAGLLTSFIGISGTGVCGGSLLSEDRVVTAAHCWFDGIHQGWMTTVVLGSITLFSGGTRMDTSAVAMHPNWNAFLIRNDVAVIYLPSKVQFSDTIAPIALPSGHELEQDYVGEVGVASGFGLTDDGELTVNQVLSHVSLTVITNSACRIYYPLNVQDSNICTSGVGGTSTCQGDSGGPLAVESNNRAILIGITSFGSARGCDTGRPAVFARVTDFIQFILQHLGH